MLTVSFTSPHSPFVISQEYWDRYDHDDIESPAVPPLDLDEMDHLSRNLHYCQGRHEFAVTDEHRRMARHGYYGMISYIDDKVGQLMKVLRETGLSEDTIVILAADHGEMMGERGMWFKQHFFEWAASVPFIIYAPQRFSASRVTENISLIDLMPTLLDLAEEGSFDGYAATVDGTSLFPALQGDTRAMSDIVISEFAADGSTGPSRMVKHGAMKLMWLEGEDTVLYDLDADPNEINNLADDSMHAETRAKMEAILFEGWDPNELRSTIRQSQEQRLAIHKITGGEPTWVNTIRDDDNARYIRNAGAADTKARARLPYVAPARPDV